jgi:hypothetical protein
LATPQEGSFFAVFVHMRFSRLLGVRARVRAVARRRMSVMSGLLVLASLVVLGCFAMVLSSMGVVFGCLCVVLRSFLRHRDFLLGQDDPATSKFVPRMPVPVGFDQFRQKPLNLFGAPRRPAYASADSSSS